MRPVRHLPRVTTALLLAMFAGHAPAGDPGRLEEDADFLLGSWSTDCALGQVEFFLSEGALRQRGLLRVAPKGGGDPVIPVTLLAATRDGPGLVLEANTSAGGFPASARYTAAVQDRDTLSLRTMTLCRAERCRSVELEVPWRRCPG